MNRQEFLDKINSSLNMKLVRNNKFGEYEEKYFFSTLEHFNKINLMNNYNKILNFAREFSGIYFERTELKSKDTILITLELRTLQVLETTKQSVAYLGDIYNACGKIECLYIAEDGRLGKAKAKQEDVIEWISYNADDFLNYLLIKEYDYHIPISENTYQKLREAGWYEGRRVDISHIIEDCEKNYIMLTQPQKDFLTEFSGIRSINPDPYERDGFFIADEPDYDNWGFFFQPKYGNQDIINCNSEIIIGMYDAAYQQLSITPDGKLRGQYSGYIGRIIMEGWEIIISCRR